MDRQEIIRQYLKLGFAVVTGPPGDKMAYRHYFHPCMPSDHHYITDITNENIGICMASDLLTASDLSRPRYAYALDFDDPVKYHWWSGNNPDLADRCPTQETKRGYHVLFTMPALLPGGKSEKITFIGHDWYILVEPSIHPDGHHYRWLKSPFDIPLPHIETMEGLGLGEHLDKIDWNVEDYDDPPWEDEWDAG